MPGESAKSDINAGQKPAATTTRITLPSVVKGVVGIAGLAVYVELVGGAVLWARYHNAQIPELQTLDALPPEYLLIVGISSLFVPFLAGAGAALLQYILAPSNPRGTLPRRFGFVLLALVAFASYMALWGVAGISDLARLVLILLALAGAGGLLMVALRTRGFVSLALLFFLYGALYGACFKIVRELTIKPRFDLAVAFRGEERRPLAGLFLARSEEKVLLARMAPDRAGSKNEQWQTIVIPGSQVTTLVFGPRGEPIDPIAQTRAEALRNLLRKAQLDLKRPAQDSSSAKEEREGARKAAGNQN